ncbi:MAG: zinc-ribbon domain-containing protein [Candidatus Pacebacteria bacterium]|nr:zinc-ribbon domain-containing protein [Candidatus Paceibacterota bacterium]
MFCAHCGLKNDENSKFCQKCGSKLADAQVKTKTNDEKPSVNVEYLAISPKRLALFSVLTFGIYEIYWFYKNWEAVKKAEGQNISPFWRAIFAVFFCHSLFKKVLESAKAHDYKESYSPGWLTAAYIALIFIGNTLSREDSSDPILNLFCLIVVSITFIPLLSVQKAINFNNEKNKEGATLKQGFSGGEVTLIVVGVLWFLLVLFGTFSS